MSSDTPLNWSVMLHEDGAYKVHLLCFKPPGYQPAFTSYAVNIENVGISYRAAVVRDAFDRWLAHHLYIGRLDAPFLRSLIDAAIEKAKALKLYDL